MTSDEIRAFLSELSDSARRGEDDRRNAARRPPSREIDDAAEAEHGRGRRLPMTQDDRRRLLSRAVKAEEDAALLRERLAAAYREIDEVRALVPAKVHQVSCAPAPGGDPLVRLFAAPRPARG